MKTIKYQVSKSLRCKKKKEKWDKVSQYTLKFSFDLLYLEGMTARAKINFFFGINTEIKQNFYAYHTGQCVKFGHANAHLVSMVKNNLPTVFFYF